MSHVRSLPVSAVARGLVEVDQFPPFLLSGGAVGPHHREQELSRSVGVDAGRLLRLPAEVLPSGSALFRLQLVVAEAFPLHPPS